MTLQTLSGMQCLWLPMVPFSVGNTLDTATYVMDATTEKVVLVFRAPFTGSMDRFGAILATIGVAPINGVRFSFQNVDGATGDADGVVDQFATIPFASILTGWTDPGAFDSSRTVTRGDLIAAVIDFPSFVATNSLTWQGIQSGFNAWAFPYGESVVNTKSVTRLPQIFLHYTDNSGFWCSVHPQIVGALTSTTASIDTGTTPDEIGLKFQVPFPCTLDQVGAWLTMTVGASDFDCILYDASNNVLATLSYDGDVEAGGTSLRFWTMYLQTKVNLSANTNYRLIFKPTSTNNIALSYMTSNSSLITTFPGGTNFCVTQRTDAGAWTDFNNGSDGYRMPSIYLGFSAFDDAAGGGGQKSYTFMA